MPLRSSAPCTATCFPSSRYGASTQSRCAETICISHRLKVRAPRWQSRSRYCAPQMMSALDVFGLRYQSRSVLLHQRHTASHDRRVSAMEPKTPSRAHRHRIQRMSPLALPQRAPTLRAQLPAESRCLRPRGHSVQRAQGTCSLW